MFYTTGMSADVGPSDPASVGINQIPVRAINTKRNTATMAEIKQAIAEAGGAIPFSQYQNIALYGRDGYYSRGKADIRGARGDFKTWPVVSTDFCEAIAVAIDKIWVAMGQPKRLSLVESGAGNGMMMKDILVWMRTERPGLYASVTVHIVEQGDMALKQRLTIAGKNDPDSTLRRGSPAETSTPDEHAADIRKVRWHRGSAIEAVVGQGGATVFISNELPDVFPVEIVRRKSGVLQQKYVNMDNGQLAEVWHPLQPEVQQYLDDFSVDVSEGGEITVNLNAVAWQRHLNTLLGSDDNPGAIITVDYGTEGPREVRSSDSVQHHDGPMDGAQGAPDVAPPQIDKVMRTYPLGLGVLEAPGELDLTSDVDFRVLAQVAREGGLDVAFSGTQSTFVTVCGVPTLSQMEAIRPTTDAMRIRTHATRLLYFHDGPYLALVLTRGISVDFSIPAPPLSAYKGLVPDAELTS